MLGLMYIRMAKSYESLQSEHSLEYMPKTWTEVDEGEWRKECNAASPTASTMAPGPSSTSCSAALNDEEFDDENYKRLDPRSALGVVAERVSCRVCPPALPPRNLAHVGMYLGAIRLRLMAAKDRKNPAFKAHILRDGGWVRKPAIATMTTDDIIEKTQAVGPILACIHTPATTHIGTGLSRKGCAAGGNKITRDKFFRKDGDRARSLLGHAWRRVLQVQARQERKGCEGRGRPCLA